VNPLLEQFFSESRESLQSIGEKLMQLEKEPGSSDLMVELFRLVHTLKGNSGLFDMPELTRVLHAGEDLMDAVRNGEVPYSPLLADRLLDVMDFVGMLCDEFEVNGSTDTRHISASVRLAEALRQLMVVTPQNAPETDSTATDLSAAKTTPLISLSEVPEETRLAAYRDTGDGDPLHWIQFSPAEDCFFQGSDPFHHARQTPGILWGGIKARIPWPELSQLDPYSCVLDFSMLSAAPLEELEEYYRYEPDQVRITPLQKSHLIVPQGFSGVWPFQPEIEVTELVAVQRIILSLPDDVSWLTGRIQAVAASLSGCLKEEGAAENGATLNTALKAALGKRSSSPLLSWLDGQGSSANKLTLPHLPGTEGEAPTAVSLSQGDGEFRYGRRSDDIHPGAKSIKVDQVKIDRLMNLIGEMVVAKNSLPYLAGRAENMYGLRELSREIKAHYAVINRIAEEMQDSIMQVCMTPISFVFQRFPRMVRDTANKLEKEVNLILEGEETEADKHVIESLGDPLVHIVRNSLDHGIELPQVRLTLGKPGPGTIVIRASQESDRVVIEIRDDGKGIDPEVIKRKAYEKGIIDQDRLERISDRDAVNLVFAAGFSTAESVSDLSGRGVGMDVVRTAVEKVNGTIMLESEKGKGTRIRLSVPLSIAVTNVMVVESNRQIFGVPMESVCETVRVPRTDIHTIKKTATLVRRGRIVPLKSLNALLGLDIPQRTNDEDELAVLIVTLGGETVGIMVDDFRETVDIILKPMTGVLARLAAYSGSALMGNGSVLMVLDLKELL
jgi:two-component system, chemotaxis family, sensor kinase CheA